MRCDGVLCEESSSPGSETSWGLLLLWDETLGRRGVDMENWIFLGVLFYGAHMDFKRKELSGSYLLVSLLIGCVCLIYSSLNGRSWIDTALSCGLGAGLLGFSYLTDGGIGEGDGWFFFISGLFLSLRENLLLLCSGWFLCVLYGLLLICRSIRGKRIDRRKQVPFLPFLIPMGVYLACFVK